MEPTKLKDLAESRFDHALYRKNLRERIEGQLIVTHEGAMFKATTELIAFLHCWDNDVMFVEDIHNRPARINRVELLTKLKEAHQFAMNAWHIEYSDASKIRKGKNV